MNAQKQVSDALTALLSRANEDGFVIFTDKGSNKVVQFVGSAGEELMLDLPVEALDPAERKRANVFMAKHGGVLEESGFIVELEHDVELATKLTIGVFVEVYGIAAPVL